MPSKCTTATTGAINQAPMRIKLANGWAFDVETIRVPVGAAWRDGLGPLWSPSSVAKQTYEASFPRKGDRKGPSPSRHAAPAPTGTNDGPYDERVRGEAMAYERYRTVTSYSNFGG